MPVAFYLSSELNDLSVDVALTAPTRGDLFYHGATKWNNLPAGTNGKVLTTHGAGADPTWETPTVPDLSTTVILAPASSARNVIQGTGDAVLPLAVKRFSGTQSEDLFQAQDETGAALLAVSPNGDVIGRRGCYFGPPTDPVLETNAYLVAVQPVGSVFDTIAIVDPGSTYGYSEMHCDLWNGVAASPRVTLFAMGAEGTYSDGGVLSGSDFYIIEGSSGKFVFAIDQATLQATISGAFTGPTFGGQLLIAGNDPTTKVLAVRAAAAQTAALQEWQNNSGVAQTSVAANGRDWILDTGTGTKWGTTSGQKQSWWGAVPVGQPTLAAAATDLATVITLANNLRSTLITLGLGA